MVAVLVCLGVGCADDAPPTSTPTPTLAAQSLQRTFEEVALPVLESRCAGPCHSAPAATWAAALEHDEHGGLMLPIDPRTGRVPADPELRRAAWEHVRGGERLDHTAGPDFSLLLREPLEAAWGGLPHGGVVVFASPEDEGYRALETWVEAELAASPEPAPELAPPAAFFRDEIVGVFERNGCFLASCHGPDVFNDLKLLAPLPHHPDDPPRLSPAMLAVNRKVALGKVSRLVNLGGDLARSRLLVKNLPLDHGGVLQRGGNQQFFESLDDPDVQLLLRWMSLEQRHLASKLTAGGRPVPTSDLGRIQGIAWLSGPRHAPRPLFDADTFWPGTRLMVVDGDGGDPDATPRALVDLPDAEIRGFDVRYDGRAIVLALRTSADAGTRLWEVDLDDRLRAVRGSLRQISFGPDLLPDGTRVHHLDPIYIPGPHDPEGHALDDVAIAFASNAAGHWAVSDAYAVLGEADGTGSTRELLVDRQRPEAAGTFDGRRVHFVAGPHAGSWRTIASHEADGRFRLDRPLGEAPDARTVFTIEARAADWRPSYDIWRVLPSRWEETARRMTFTAAQERRPTLRTTGEVMFTSVRNRGYQGGRPVFNGAIFRVMAGGFDYHIHGNNRSRYPLVLDSRELPSGLEVRLASAPANLWGSGLPLLVDHGFGVNIEPDNPVDAVDFSSGGPHPPPASQRFLPTMLPMFEETGAAAVTYTGVSAGGGYRDIYPHVDGSVFVAHAAGPLDQLDPAADPDWTLHRLRFPGALQAEDGRTVGPFELEPLPGTVSPDPETAETHPRPIAIRLKEKPHTHQKFHPRDDDLEPADVDGVERLPASAPSTGEIECYDYPLLQSFLIDFSPTGAREFLDDQLAWVRIVRQDPPRRVDVAPVHADDPFATRMGLGVHTPQTVVSEVPIESDGSFYARVPAEVPLIVQGLDRDRRAIHSMNRWFYVQPGEKLTFAIPRSIFPTRCAGCHGAVTGRPADALGPTDVVTAASRVMATWAPMGGARRPPAPIEPVVVDFVDDVQPILDRRCVRCHYGEADRAGGLDLRGTPDGPWTTAYRTLHQLAEPESGDHARKLWIDERQSLSGESRLIDLLLASPHPQDEPPTRQELLTLIRWIDLGATFIGGEVPP